MSQTKTIKCSACGLTNWAAEPRCKRCNSELHDQNGAAAFSSTSSTSDQPRKIPLAMYPLFFLLYVLGVGLSGAVVFLLFYVGNSFKIVSVTYAIVAVVLGFVVPLAAVHYLIEDWKTRITGKPYEVSGDAGVFEPMEEYSAGIPLWLKIIQAFIVLTVAGVSAAVSGQILNAYLPEGAYPALLLGLPALVLGLVALVVSSVVIKSFTTNK
ncbi:MAG TPA: hypothetical protein VGC97_01510 [Pyrinomonadaceae bacterium]|jgi:hypothetical protein